MGLRINKGAESMPIIFWDLLYKDQNGKRWKSRAHLTPEGKATLTPENFFILTPLKS